MESRYFVVKCPYDLHVGFGRDDKGKPHLVNRAGGASPVRGSKLAQVLTLVAEGEWRFPDRPTLQLSLPYCFIADETVYLTQLGTFAHYRRDPLPGTIFGGRFPINIWPRPIMWAFEWPMNLEKFTERSRGFFRPPRPSRCAKTTSGWSQS
jgi:hypothetical protein